jgi:hypothetical protein
MSPEGAYYLRRQKGAEDFRAAWDAALDFGVQSLADIAIERARDGVPVPVFYKGEQVGERRWYNDRLLMFILKHHMPSKYGANLSGGTKHPDTIAREAAASNEEVIAALTRRLSHFGVRVGEEKAREQRALYERCQSDPDFRRAWELVNDRPCEALIAPDDEPEEDGEDLKEQQDW